MLSISNIKNYFKKGGLTEQQRYEIEKQDQKEGFINDALDFYSANNIEKYEQTFNSINAGILKNIGHIQTPVGKMPKFNASIWLAAAVIVIVVGGVYLFLNGNKKNGQLSAKQLTKTDTGATNSIVQSKKIVIHPPVATIVKTEKDTLAVVWHKRKKDEDDDDLLGVTQSGNEQNDTTSAPANTRYRFSFVLTGGPYQGDDVFYVQVIPGSTKLKALQNKALHFTSAKKIVKAILLTNTNQSDTITLVCNHNMVVRTQ